MLQTRMAAKLSNAAQSGDLTKLEEALMNSPNSMNVTSALLYAAVEGHLEIVKRLLEVPGIDVNTTTAYGATPLLFAAQNGHLEVVKRLLEVPGIDVNKAMTGEITPLFMAVQFGLKEVVKRLLEVPGIDVNKARPDGITPLYFATQKGHLEIVKLLLEVPGIDVNKARTDETTPLFMAAQKGYVEIVKRLLEVPGIDVNKARSDGSTPLLIAALNGHLEIVKRLLEVPGIDVNAIMANGITPLLLAAQNGHLEIVKRFLEVPGIDVNKARTDRTTPLFMAAQNGHLEVVKRLLEVPGIDVNKSRTNGATPLLVAALKGHFEVVKRLLEVQGIDVNKALADGNTPLFMAAQNGHVEIVKRLLEVPGIDTKIVLENIYSFSDDIKAIFEDLIPKWKPITRSSISLFDAIFDTETPTDPVTGLPTGKKPAAINTSTCPVCFSYTVRSEACNYMKHNCTAHGNYYNKALYNKYKNPEGEISWCTICGRICVGHRHYKLSDPDGPKPELAELPIGGENFFADDCRRGGGGGLEEKFKRFRRAREVLKDLDSTLRYDEAMDILIEEMWRAPLSRMPLKSKINAMMAAKKFTNYPTETFPPNEVATAAAAIVKVIDPIASSRLPELVTLASPVMNAFSYNDLPTILHFKHGSMSANRPDAHKDETDVSKDVDRIGIASFFDQLKARIEKGEIGVCWKHPECQTPLHPDEVDEVVRMAIAEGGMNAKVVEAFQEIARRYRGQFTMKFGRIVPTGATGGGTAQPAGGAGLGRRTRRRVNTRKSLKRNTLRGFR